MPATLASGNVSYDAEAFIDAEMLATGLSAA
jgi:hypothetical protein